MQSDVIIAERFRGPTSTANGGYTCGLLAALLDGPAQVTLRRPPPIERRLLMRGMADGGVELLDGDEVVAEAVTARVEVEIVAPVRLAAAEAASARFPGFARHPFPECFVCGPQRTENERLRIFPGPVAGRRAVAAPWIPDPSLGGPDGHVRPEFMWAALDCPGAFSGSRLRGLKPEPAESPRRGSQLKERAARSSAASRKTGWPAPRWRRAVGASWGPART